MNTVTKIGKFTAQKNQTLHCVVAEIIVANGF